MKISETATLVGRLMKVYPSGFRCNSNSKEEYEAFIADTVSVWHSLIGDLDYQKAYAALDECIKDCKYVPTIAEITEKYNAIIEKEHQSDAKIRTYYKYACGSYPETIEKDTGWEEWKARVKNGDEAEMFYKVIMQYLRESEEVNVIKDFLECVKTICRDSNGKIYFKEV